MIQNPQILAIYCDITTDFANPYLKIRSMNRKTHQMQSIDKLIGQSIRWFRNQQGLTQKQLAARLGISYQQLHKYETGLNGVSASMLSDIATTLNITVSKLFEGVEETGVWTEASIRHEELKLAHYYTKISDVQCRSAIMTLIKAMGKHPTT